MAMKTPEMEARRREAELLRYINRSNSIEADNIKQLINAKYNIAKEKLVAATGDEILRCQGEAQCLRRLYNDLTRDMSAPKE